MVPWVWGALAPRCHHSSHPILTGDTPRDTPGTLLVAVTQRFPAGARLRVEMQIIGMGGDEDDEDGVGWDEVEGDGAPLVVSPGLLGVLGAPSLLGHDSIVTPKHPLALWPVGTVTGKCRGFPFQ